MLFVLALLKYGEEGEWGAKHHGVFYEDIRNNRKITTLIKSWRRDLTVHKNIPKKQETLL